MKNYLLVFISCIVVGLFLSKLILNQYNIETTSVDIKEEDVYFFQAGAYEKLENAKEKANSLESYVISKEDKYYIYVGITKSEENKEKLKKYFTNNNIDFYVKTKKINNIGILDNVEQYDILLKNTKNDNEIRSVTKSILATYEEMINNAKN